MGYYVESLSLERVELLKKLSFILVVLIMIMNMPCSLMAESTYIDTLRIGLSYGDNASGEAWFYSEAPIDIVDAYYSSYITSVPANTKFQITNYGGAFTSNYFSPIGSIIRLEGTDTIFYNDKEYRGSFELRGDGAKITVINIVNTEEYLTSVLGKEMSASWPIEALKAQAVCARNYAITMVDGKHKGYGFDLCSTTDCQVYAGVSSEAESTIQAVYDTRAVNVKYEGEIVPLYYFSCDGGYTENSENVWMTALGYLKGKEDIYENPEYATLYNWSKTMTKEEIENILISKNVYIGSLCDIRIDSVSENNGVLKLTFVGSEGEHSVTKTGTRTFLSLNSQAYTIEKNTDALIAREEVETVEQTVITSEGIVSVTNPQYAMTGEGLKEIAYTTNIVYDDIEAFDSYTFIGHGWGHLVGMSQWGAYSMAKLGYTYEDILNFYFTDITIEKYQPLGFGDEIITDISEEVADDYIDDESANEIQRNDTGI